MVRFTLEAGLTGQEAQLPSGRNQARSVRQPWEVPRVWGAGGDRVSSSACAYAPASPPMVARLLMPSRGADGALPGEMLTG